MTQIRTPLKVFLHLLVLLALAVPMPREVMAQGGMPGIIRDTEIENNFKEWISPLLKSADLNDKSINLVLVQSPQINAFVAGGANLFIYTGLIERTDNPDEVIGVMAHELGHIAGGHLINMRGAYERASYESILGMVLGVGAAIATGNGAAASAIMHGSSNIATRRFLANSRVNESSADQAAMRFLDSAKINPTGLKTFMQKLESEELMPTDQQSEYVRTHPLTRDRIDALGARLSSSPYASTPLPASWVDQHARIKAKLIAFTNPGRVPWVYEDRDTSIPARYARAIAAYRQKDVDKAAKLMDDLIASEPDNPYFQELKGQMLLEFGRVREAIPYYRTAVKALPEAGLIRISLAHALLESNPDKSALSEAVDQLQRALKDEPRSGRAHRLLATAYGRMGNEGAAKLHLAEEAFLQRDIGAARPQAEGALKLLPPGSREALQAQDLLDQIEMVKDQEEYKPRKN